jgi:hypothetical protein
MASYTQLQASGICVKAGFIEKVLAGVLRRPYYELVNKILEAINIRELASYTQKVNK